MAELKGIAVGNVGTVFTYTARNTQTKAAIDLSTFGSGIDLTASKCIIKHTGDEAAVEGTVAGVDLANGVVSYELTSGVLTVAGGTYELQFKLVFTDGSTLYQVPPDRFVAGKTLA